MNVAIIGTGISGLAAAHRLHREHRLTLFEASDWIGGHTHTHDVEWAGRRFAIDTGFIVHNERNYPRFRALMDELGVATKRTSMSFSVACERTGLEYGSTNLASLFAQKRNLLRPVFHGMLASILRFNREAPRLLDHEDALLTLGEYLARHRYPRAFVDQYIVPMGAAVWSASTEQMLAFPAQFFVRFLHNHGMLSIRNQPQWRVIEGGSREYVRALVRPFADRIRLSTPVRSVRRFPDRVEIATEAGLERFDAVVLASHADQSLRLLADPTESERQILSALPYQRNETVLHVDESRMPARRRAWSSWNYRIPREGQATVSVTYDMNILQGLEDAPATFLVSLNDEARIDPAKVLARMTYHHPVYTVAGIAARKRRSEISGANRTAFAGAYWGYGFHEDGVESGFDAADRIASALERARQPQERAA